MEPGLILLAAYKGQELKVGSLAFTAKPPHVHLAPKQVPGVQKQKLALMILEKYFNGYPRLAY